MVYLIINWVLSTVSLLILVNVLPGYRVNEFEAVLLATGAVGLLSALLGLMLRRSLGPLSLVMSAAFLFLVDAVLFRVSALMVPGFAMRGFTPALVGAVLLLALNLALLRYVHVKDEGFGHETVRLSS